MSLSTTTRLADDGTKPTLAGRVSISGVVGEAARLLLDARDQARLLDRLPIACRPTDIDSALAIQEQVTELLRSRGDEVAAWKCASPSGAKVIAAPIYRSKIQFATSDSVLLKAAPGAKDVLVEPEMALVMKTDLPPRGETYRQEEIRDAVGEVRLSLEIIGSRFSDPGTVSFPELLADGLLNNGLVIGPSIARETVPENIPLSIVKDQRGTTTIPGSHPEADVWRPLYWLVQFLNERGNGLRAGQAIITGSYAGVLSMEVNCRYAIQFDALGTIDFAFESISTKFEGKPEEKQCD
jgi:2-keto-4-pentenoate hydratase